MTGGEDRSRGSRSRTSNDDGLGAFASEAQEAAASVSAFPAETGPAHELVPAPVVAPAPKHTGWHWLESPALVSAAMALAVVVYGGLMVLWWEREPPSMKPAFQGPPTASYRPVAPAPSREAAPPAAAPAPATPTAEPLPADFFVPAVARTADTVRPSEMATVRPPAARPERRELSEDAGVSPVSPATPPLPTPAPPAVVLPEPPPPPAAAAAAAPAIEPRAVDPVIADRAAIGDVLQSYRTSYNALDATSVSTIWQGLDTRALQRAFSTLSEQQVSFDRCDVRVTGGDRAEAVCRGLLTYVPKIGDGSPQQRRLAWTFDFRRAADRWLIAQVSAR